MGHYGKAYSFIKIEPQTAQHSGVRFKERQSNLLNKTKWWYGSYYKWTLLCRYRSRRWKPRGLGLQPGTALISKDLSKNNTENQI